MVVLTVGYVSGIIAAGIYAVQFFIPTATTLLLAGLLREDSTAATWSVVGRALHSSHWPVLLSSDSQVNVGISRVASIESRARPLILGVVSIAAIVTPLGLYDAVVPVEDPVHTVFKYARDPSPMGFGTPPRSDLEFNRICGFATFIPCPSSNVVVNSTYKNGILDIEYPYGYDGSIPQNLTEIFQSGLENMEKTVSSIFDIEYRTYEHKVDKIVNNGSRFISGAFRQIETLALNDDIRAVEGLIVDTKSGGIGFRNHTIPEPLTYGVKWSEDLLFIEPETQCVDTNITLDFTLSDVHRPTKLMLTDRGGFANLMHENPEFEDTDTQANPDLQARAYKAAWVNNAMTMFFLNISNPADGHSELFTYMDSTVGKKFSLPEPEKMEIYADALITSLDWGSFLNPPRSYETFARSRRWEDQKRQTGPKEISNQKDTTGPTATSNEEDGENSEGTSKPTKTSNSKQTSSVTSNFDPFETSNLGSKKYPNPFDVSEKNFTAAQAFCQGATSSSHANISNIGVICGMVFGAARRQDGSQSLIFDRGTDWTVPLFSCASAAKATIKTVDFQYNGTDGFDSLKVLGVRAKTYESEDQKPLWGIERTEMNLQHGSPLWGLVSARYQGNKDISVIRNEELWLPGYQGMAESPTRYDNTPGANFHTDALTVVYNISPSTIKSTIFDYSGLSHLAMYAKWQELSREASTASNILNLVWADVAANSVVGTRGWVQDRAPTSLSKRDNDDGRSDAEARVSVNTFERRIRYQLPFATPAIIAGVATLIIAVATTALFFFGNAKPEVMRKFLFHTSVGRVMASYAYPGQCHPQAPTNEWMKLAGRNRIDVSGYAPQGMGLIMMPNQSTTTFDAPLLNNGYPAPQAPYPASSGLPGPPYPTYSPATWKGKNDPH